MAETFAPPQQVEERGDAAVGFLRGGPLSLLAAITICYLAGAFVFLAGVGANPVQLVLRAIAAFGNFAQLAQEIVPWWLAAGLFGTVVTIAPIRSRIAQNRREIILSLIYCSAFASAFGLVKTHLPLLVPFWADPLFTQIDAGTNLKWLYAWLGGFSTDAMLQFYFNGWVLVATFLPVILCLVDDNEARRRRFVILWAACWVGLGNILAAIFMSAGPIFLDRLPGGEAAAYPEVMALLSREDGQLLLMVKNNLWNAYAGGDFTVGSGISAFPSVHVGMACVVALFVGALLREKAALAAAPRAGKALSVLGWVLPVALVLAFQVLSVHLGWHYAVDGYASIALICALNWYLHRREVRG